MYLFCSLSPHEQLRRWLDGSHGQHEQPGRLQCVRLQTHAVSIGATAKTESTLHASTGESTYPTFNCQDVSEIKNSNQIQLICNMSLYLNYISTYKNNLLSQPLYSKLISRLADQKSISNYQLVYIYIYRKWMAKY